jgi:hypothetical protein
VFGQSRHMHNCSCGETMPSCYYFLNQGGKYKWFSPMCHQVSVHSPHLHTLAQQNKLNNNQCHLQQSCMQQNLFAALNAAAPIFRHHCPASLTMHFHSHKDVLCKCTHYHMEENQQGQLWLYFSVLGIVCGVSWCVVSLVVSGITQKPTRVTGTYTYWCVAVDKGKHYLLILECMW